MKLNIDSEMPDYLKTTKLSNREIQVVVELMQGHPAKRIAHNIFLSVNTVQTHLQRIRYKLNAENNVQVAIKYLQLLDNPILCLKKIAPVIAFGFLSLQSYSSVTVFDIELRKPTRVSRILRVRKK